MQLLRELSMGLIVSRLAAVLLYAGLQGFVLAGLAWLLGDRRPAHDGRLTLNPFPHLSVWGAAMAALFAMSWIRPLWFAPDKQSPWSRWRIVLVVVAGLAIMISLIPLIDLLRQLALLLPRTGGYAMIYVLQQVQAIALASALINLLPVPGLVGGAMLHAIWPDQERRLKRLEPIGLAVLIVAIVAGWLPDPATFVQPFLSWR